MQLHEFFDYKNQLMKDILTNEKIVHLINPDIAMEDANSLAYTQVFPSEYIPETVDDGKTYVMFDVDVNTTYEKTFYEPILYIWIMVHGSQMRLPTGGVRSDELCSEIAEAINGSFNYGLGALDFLSARRYAPMTDYVGKVLTFKARDFNKVYDPTRPIPKNRKRA